MSAEKFTFFWFGPFSQWHICSFIVDGIVYNSSEQFMMAMKAMYFLDDEVLAEIMATDSPKKQKGLGRKVNNFDADKWNLVCKDFVYKGNKAKFEQNHELKLLLLATEGTTLVEASPYDKIWGIGLSEHDPKSRDRSTWKGKNWLGEVLTKLREDMIAEASLVIEEIIKDAHDQSPKVDGNEIDAGFWFKEGNS